MPLTANDFASFRAFLQQQRQAREVSDAKGYSGFRKLLQQRRQARLTRDSNEVASAAGVEQRALAQLEDLKRRLDELEQVIQRAAEQRAERPKSLADQEHEQTVPAAEIENYSETWGTNNPFTVAKEYAERAAAQDSYDGASRLGREIAKKYNPHYKAR